MKSKIRIAFEKCKKEKRPALITYTVAGDNTKKNSLKILNSISNLADPEQEALNQDLEREQTEVVGALNSIQKLAPSK